MTIFHNISALYTEESHHLVDGTAVDAQGTLLCLLSSFFMGYLVYFYSAA